MTDMRTGRGEKMDIKAVRRGRSGTVMALVVVLAGVLGLLAMPSAQASGTGATTGAIALNGAGFGHGVGMSQYGAYGQAKANPALTGAQIAQYYYTGSTVASYADNVPLKINVGHARQTMALRSTSLGTGGGGFTAQVAGLPDRLVPVTQYVTVGWTTTGILLVVRNVSDGLPVLDGELRGASDHHLVADAHDVGRDDDVHQALPLGHAGPGPSGVGVRECADH